MHLNRIGLLALFGVAAAICVPAVDAVRAQDGSFDIALHHVAISVPDLDASVAWYEDILGFKELRRFTDPGVPTTIALITRGDVRIELFQTENAAPLPPGRHDPTEDLRTHGVKHFGLQVTNLRAIVEDLKAKGVEITKELVEGPRSSFVFISDNAGNSLELIEPKQ